MTVENLKNIPVPDDLNKCEDLTGMVFGRLTVLQYAGRNKHSRSLWYCVCSCNDNKVVGPKQGYHLKNGSIVSCGCYSREATSKRSSKENKIEYINNTVIKVFFNNEQHGYFICDADDWEIAKNICWRRKSGHNTDNLYYAFGSDKSNNYKDITFHRFITNAKENEIIDHINGNGLDCRRCNLRHVDTYQNSQNTKISTNNTSGFKGVGWSKRYNKWRARIKYHHKEYHLGYFANKDDAIEARRKKEQELQKEYSLESSRKVASNNTKSIDAIVQEILEEGAN